MTSQQENESKKSLACTNMSFRKKSNQKSCPTFLFYSNRFISFIKNEKKDTHSLCVCCKNLVLTRHIDQHERECRGFQRFRPLIPRFEHRMEAARIASLKSKAVTCFCGAQFNHQSISKHQAKQSCSKRFCRVCGISISSMLFCEEHRCVCFILLI